ncbi:MAG: diguanylate cyclase [Sandaracinaceae bacterium]|nr:diguanylate cyclase [Sandaracinaceae bacterium]
MERARRIEGLGWVHPGSRSFVLPRASAMGAAPEGALPFELVERGDGAVAVVRGSMLDARDRSAVRACLGDVVRHVVVLLASDRDAFVVDGDADAVTAVEALAVLRDGELDDDVVEHAGAAVAHRRGRRERVTCVGREARAVEAAYRGAARAGVVRADLDRLMVYNDWLGVLEGDLLLARLVGLACAVVRESAVSDRALVSMHRRDVLVVGPDLDARGTQSIADAFVERMRRSRVQLRHDEVRNVPYMTLSAGAVWVSNTAQTPVARALEEVDLAVQHAKLAGRDRVAFSRME